MNFKMMGKTTFQSRPCFHIVAKDKPGQKEKGGRMSLWIDAERYTLVRMEVYDGDKFVSSIEGKAFREFESGRWLPGRVVVENNTPDALEKATYRLSKVIVNQEIDPKSFDTQYAEGVRLVKGGEKDQKQKERK